MLDRYQLFFGPYEAPRVSIGDIVHCEIRGPLIVRGWSNGRIPWPLGHPGGKHMGRNSLIVCGDLIRAVQRESNIAVQYWWGVKEKKVTVWRQALGVADNNEGTHELRTAYVHAGTPRNSSQRTSQ